VVRIRSGFVACLALSLGLTLLLGAGVLFAGRTFTPTDFLTSRAPWNGINTSDAFLQNRNAQDILEFDAVEAIGAGESLRRGELFLWEPRTFCGWPAVGDPQLGTFYPPRLLLLRLLPPLLALDVLILLHFLGAGLAMYALAREWGLRQEGALVSSLTWLLCGPQMVWFRYAGGLPASVYLPLLALALHRGLSRRCLDWVAISGALWAFLFMAAHPQLSFLALVWCAACFAVDLHRGDARWTVKAGALFAVAGAGLAAIQLLPFLESLRDSQKATFEGVGFVRPTRVPLLLATLLWQRCFGSPIDRVDLTTPLTGDNFFSLQGYMGLLPLLLAILAWRRGRFLWILALGSLILATCYPLWWLIIKLIPFLRVLDPHRLYLFAFVMSLLAGLGMEELLDRPPGRRLKMAATAASGLILLGGLVGLLCSATWIVLLNPAYIALTAATLAATGAVWIAGSASTARIKTAAACAAILTDLLPGMLAYNATYPPLPPEPPMMAALPKDGRLRIALASSHYRIGIGNFSTVYGASTAEGYGSQYPRAYAELARCLDGQLAERRVVFSRLAKAQFVLNGRSVIDEEGPRSEDSLPRAWMVGKAVVLPDYQQRIGALTELNLEKVAVVEEPVPPMERTPVGDVSPLGLNEYRVRCDRACLLVISENYHPGWRADVDGRDMRILRADHSLRAIPLAAGDHHIVLSFRPGSVALGLALSGATALLLGTLAGASRLLKRRIRGGTP